MISNWEQVTKELSKRINKEEFDTWIKPLRGDLKNNKLELRAPNNFIFNYVRKNFAEEIEKILEKSNISLNIINTNNETFVDKYVIKKKKHSSPDTGPVSYTHLRAHETG